MWLLDVSMPRQTLAVLESWGVKAETARNLGWDRLRNGDLLSQASAAGFQCLLTRDKDFGSVASKAHHDNARLAIVIVTLPQRQADDFVALFVEAWQAEPIEPVAGSVVWWPERS